MYFTLVTLILLPINSMALFLKPLGEFDQLACQNSFPIGDNVNLDWIGDLICDDDLNIEACNYDGGDCCIDLSVLNGVCTVCKCYEEILKKTSEEPLVTPLIIGFFNGTHNVTMEYFVTDQSETTSTLLPIYGKLTTKMIDESLTKIIWQNDFESNNVKHGYRNSNACVHHNIFCLMIYLITVISFHY